MARQRASKNYLSVPKGLNTETSVLNPVEGTTSDELNMDLRLNGLIRSRRLGLENIGADQATTGIVIGGWYWESGDSFVVVALNEEADPATYDTVTLYFYDGDLVYYNEWTVRVVKGTGKYPNFSDIRNRMVITFGANPFVFVKEATGCYSAWVLDLYIRDFKLLDDGLSIAERPGTLTDEHHYNLLNAGWYQDRITTGTDPAIGDPLDQYFNAKTEYPSNADIVYLGDVPNSNAVNIFNPDVIESLSIGNTEAPRGHYVYDIRDIDRQERVTFKTRDGTPSTTITKVLDCDTNVSGLGGNLLYEGTTPAGTASDPSGGGGGGDSTLPDRWEDTTWEKEANELP